MPLWAGFVAAAAGAGWARSFVRSTDLRRRRRRSLAPGPAWPAPLAGESVELTPAPDTTTTHPSSTRHTRPHTPTPTTAAPSPCYFLALLPLLPARPPPTLTHTPAHPRTAPACALVIHTYHTLWARSDTSGYVLITPHPRPPHHPRLSLTLPLPTQVSAHDDDTDHDAPDSPTSPRTPYPIPASPPPSFHSRASSPAATSRRLLADDPLANDADGTLADTFDAESDDDETDDRQRLMRGTPDEPPHVDDSSLRPARPGRQRSVTQLPEFNTVTAGAAGRIYGGGQNDGVFANLSAKPTRGEELEEKPPVCLFSLLTSYTYISPCIPTHMSISPRC